MFCLTCFLNLLRIATLIPMWPKFSLAHSLSMLKSVIDGISPVFCSSAYSSSCNCQSWEKCSSKFLTFGLSFDAMEFADAYLYYKLLVPDCLPLSSCVDNRLWLLCLVPIFHQLQKTWFDENNLNAVPRYLYAMRWYWAVCIHVFRSILPMPFYAVLPNHFIKAHHRMVKLM